MFIDQSSVGMATQYSSGTLVPSIKLPAYAQNLPIKLCYAHSWWFGGLENNQDHLVTTGHTWLYLDKQRPHSLSLAVYES